MRTFMTILLAIGIAAPALSQGSGSCNAEAAARKLAGTAKTEFLRQCEMATKARMTLAAKENKKAAVMSAGKAEQCGHSASDL